MTTRSTHDQASPETAWLTTYYFCRGMVSALWVIAAFTIGSTTPALAAILLVAYPAWDALANYVDAQRSGGLSRNRSQALNVAISVATAVAVVIALGRGMNAVLVVFGIWAVLAGVFQLATGVRRWKTERGQWLMILSGGQSALAGLFFLKVAAGPMTPGIADITPYAGLGAFYFLASGIWLVVARMLKRTSPTAAH